MKHFAILLLLAALVPRPGCAADLVEGTARVVDGDTIEVQEERIRLWGIDAPENSQFCTQDGARYPCGLDAAQALRKHIGDKPVSCVYRDTDHYGRMVALCTVDGVDISQWMVQQGQAIAFRKYSLDYVADEDHAREAKLGIWAGEFQDPSEFRHQPRRTTPRGEHHDCTCPDDTDRAGRRCGRRSAYARSGSAMSACAVR